MNKNKNRLLDTEKGFTLVEIMIVLALVTMLAGFAGVKLMGKLKQGRRDGAKIELAQFQQALDSYFLQFNMYPDSGQGLQALIKKPSGGKVPENYPEEGFYGKKEIPKDPFGNEYNYECQDNQHYKIWSNGPDGQSGTEDDVVVENM